MSGKTIDEISSMFRCTKLTISRNLKKNLGEKKFKEFLDNTNNKVLKNQKTIITHKTKDENNHKFDEEELLVDKATLSKMWVLRRILMPMGTIDGMEFLLDKLKPTKNNDEFFDSMNN